MATLQNEHVADGGGSFCTDMVMIDVDNAEIGKECVSNLISCVAKYPCVIVCLGNGQRQCK